MGPSRVVGSTSQRNNGPMRCHQQQLLKAQWTHPEPSAAPLRKTMGPCKVSGSICYKCSGPIRRYWQHLSEKQWAQAKLAAESAINAVGPFTDVGSTSQRSNGPRRSWHQQQLQIRWAHLRESAAFLQALLILSIWAKSTPSAGSRWILRWAHSWFPSTFTQWAHVGFSNFSGQIAHGLYQLLRQRSLTLCARTCCSST